MPSTSRRLVPRREHASDCQVSSTRKCHGNLGYCITYVFACMRDREVRESNASTLVAFACRRLPARKTSLFRRDSNYGAHRVQTRCEATYRSEILQRLEPEESDTTLARTRHYKPHLIFATDIHSPLSSTLVNRLSGSLRKSYWRYTITRSAHAVIKRSRYCTETIQGK
ncbi:hypothetical protein PLICRDRAFT_284876 [Plicaturopsis crispa FD-325 SS-3]|nr:hypothetical protein PLICRDRAFT_284876 [Plicaturopsis crispa FD-325 SS-3]